VKREREGVDFSSDLSSLFSSFFFNLDTGVDPPTSLWFLKKGAEHLIESISGFV